MSVAPARNDAATHEPTGLCLRRDLIHRKLCFGDQWLWVIKDPISAEFFYFSEREFSILRTLDGRCPSEIIRAYTVRYADEFLSGDALASFLAQVRRSGLLRIGNVGETETYRSQQGRRAGGLLSPLAIKIPGVNPDRLLGKISPYAGFLFSPAAVVIAILTMLVAALLLLIRSEQFFAELLDVHLWTTADLAVTIVLVIAFTKIVHELAHGLACRHYGGSCPEIGLMFLVFVPCLYCDVTDAWLQPNRWKRMVVSAAGMFAELTIAAIATILWSVTVAGPLHTICLSLIVVCSISTVIFNGNPLMRYDGYYILSDLMQIPNLAAESSARLMHWVKRIVIGVAAADQTSDIRRADWFMVPYALLSLLYRIVIIALILIAIHQFAHGVQLSIIAWLLTFLVLSSITWRLARYARQARLTATQRRSIRRGRVGAGVVLMLLASCVLLYPFPRRLSLPFATSVVDQHAVYAPTSGKLTFVASENQRVSVGQTIAEIDNRELRLEIADLRLQEKILRLRLDRMESMRGSSQIIARQIPALRESVEAAKSRRKLREQELQRSRITAEIDGIVFAPRKRNEAPRNDHDPRDWTGTPLDPENRGCFIDRGTHLCTVGSAANTVSLFASQQQIDSLRTGQAVDILFPGAPGGRIEGKILTIHPRATHEIPVEVASKNWIPVEPAARGTFKPLDPIFRVDVSVGNPSSATMPLRTTGIAWVRVEPQSVLARVIQFCADSFRFAGSR